MPVVEICVLHTNDLHSNLEAWPRLAALIRREQATAAAAGLPVLLLDAGDHMDMSDTLCYGTRGELNCRLLADLGYHAYTPGNNETLRLPLERLETLGSQSPFPWLAANLRRYGGAPLHGLQDWALLQVGPVRVGLFGLTTPFPGTGPFLGTEPLDIGETVARCTAELRRAGADVVILLSHLGLQQDRRIAPGGHVDAIIGGHTHDALLQPENVAGVPVAQAGCYGAYAGRLVLRVDLAERRLAGWSGRLLAAAAVQPDRRAAALLEEGKATAAAVLGEVLTVLPRPLPHTMTGHSRLAPLIAEALRRYWQAEIGLIVGGQALYGLPAGPVSHADVIAACPSLMLPGMLELRGHELRALLEEAEDPGRHNTQVIGAGLRGEGVVVGRVFASGITFLTDAAAPLGERISHLRVGGAALDPDRMYTAGACTLLRFKGAGYDAIRNVRIARRAMPTLVREIFIDYLRGLTPRPSTPA